MRLESGTQLGHFKILSPLGKGGMGEVYRALDLRLDREVAIKVIPEALADDESLMARFEKEAKALAALAHPNIVTIFDFGNANGITYAVTEILEGESLRSAISASGLPLRRVVEIAVAIAEGMAAAHSKGIIHRDLKPENVFLLKDGRIKILDFGLVHWRPQITADELSSVSTLMPETEANKVLGTVPYLPPEQLKGSPVDARSDIFSFGCILYELLSGKHPFLGKTFSETTAAILKDEPSRPSLKKPDIPPPLERTLFRCLEKNPDNRFQSAKDLAFDLSSSLDTSFSTPITPVTVPRKSPVFPKVFIGVLILSLVAAGIWWWQKQSGKSQDLEKSIAVLPFTNMTEDKEDEYFSDGITEDIITHLSKIDDLKVVSRTTSLRYKKTKKSIQEIGKELKVAVVLEGSVRRQGDRLRIVAQLIDAEADSHIWAETYDRHMKDVFAIQSDVAQKIASALHAELTPQERKKIEKAPTQNVTAYDYYLKGRQYYTRYQKEHNETAIQLYKKSIEVDPNFALAYVGLCDCYTMQPSYGVKGPSLDLAIDTCNKALSIEPDLAVAHATIYKAYMWKGLTKQAETALNKAYELDPNDPIVVGRMASDFTQKGKLEEAFPLAKRNLEMEPTNAFPYFTMGAIYYQLADFEKAENFLKNSLELQPDLGFAVAWLTRVYLAQGKSAQALEAVNKFRTIRPEGAHRIIGFMESFHGDYPKAIESWKKVPDPFFNYRLAHALYKVGNKSEADKILNEAEAQTRASLLKTNIERESDLACIYAIRGERDKALKQLQKASDLGYCEYNLIEKDPIFEQMRQDPEFQKILQEMKTKVTELRRRIYS